MNKQREVRKRVSEREGRKHPRCGLTIAPTLSLLTSAIFLALIFISFVFFLRTQAIEGRCETTVEDKMQITHNLNKNVVCTHICLLNRELNCWCFFIMSADDSTIVWVHALVRRRAKTLQTWSFWTLLRQEAAVTYVGYPHSHTHIHCAWRESVKRVELSAKKTQSYVFGACT